MPDTPSPTTLSPIASLVKTRKGLAALISTIVASVYAVALTVSYFQGKLSPTAYHDSLKLAGGAVMAAWGLYTWGVTTEDAATKSAPTNIGSVAGDVVNAQPAAPAAAKDEAPK